MDDDETLSEMRCTYCGNWVYGDSVRCPKCGNYTDGLGRFQPERPRIPRIFVIAGWLVLLALLLPLLLSLWHLLRR
jgi:hypothetical protein